MTRALRFSLVAVVAAPLALAAQVPARAQDGSRPIRAMMVPLETALSADTVTVGDRFRVVASAWLPPGSWIELEPPADSESVQLVSPPKTTADSASGRIRVELEMVAWRTGLPDTLPVRARVVQPDGGSRPIQSTLRLPFVRSVLPPDTSKHVPRGPRDVWGPSRPWPLLAALAAALLLLLALAAWLLLRRRRRKRLDDGRTPRERALAALEEARASGLAEAGEWKAFYTLVSDALRRYAMTVDMRWGTDLTTSELLAEMRAHRVPGGALEPLAHLLRVADLAKFARVRRAPDDAARDLETAKRWVETFDRATAKSIETEPVLAGAGAEEVAR
jgi:hypothetical protein